MKDDNIKLEDLEKVTGGIIPTGGNKIIRKTEDEEIISTTPDKQTLKQTPYSGG